MNNIYTTLESYHCFNPVGDANLDQHNDNHYIDETHRFGDVINDILKLYNPIKLYCAIDEEERELAFFEYTLQYRGVNLLHNNIKMKQIQNDMFAIGIIIDCLAKMYKLESW